MRTLELYHGGEQPVRMPQIVSPRLNRPLDFGQGFYTTTSYEQANRWVGVRIKQRTYAQGCVSRDVCDLDVVDRLKVCRFHGADETWFQFVMENRHSIHFVHEYDIVWGSVANDNVYETLTLFEDGIINRSEAISRLRTYKLVAQVLFHTAQALESLQFVDYKEYVP